MVACDVNLYQVDTLLLVIIRLHSISLCHSWTLSKATWAFITTSRMCMKNFLFKSCTHGCFNVLYVYLWIYLCRGCLRCPRHFVATRRVGKCWWWVASHNWKCKRISICSRMKSALMVIVILSVFMVMLMYHCFLSFHTSLWCWMGFVNTVYY